MTCTGEMVLPRNAVVMPEEEMRYVEGGVATVVFFVGGIAVGYFGVIKCYLGYSAEDWVVRGMKAARNYWKKHKKAKRIYVTKGGTAKSH